MKENPRTIGKDELVVFLDAKPAEVIDVQKDQFLCFTAVTAGFDCAFGYKPFKKTRKKRKISTIKKLTRQIQDGHFDIKAISIIGKMNGQYVHWACDSINTTFKHIGAVWNLNDGKPNSLTWRNHTFELKHILGISIYSNMLAIIGLFFSIFAKKHGYKKLLFALDNLPIDSAVGMELMRNISETSPDIKEMWKNNMSNGVSFQIANLKSYSNDNVIGIPGKNHPVAIFSDWLSVTSIAKINPLQLKEESNFSDEETDLLVRLWEAVNSRRSFEVIDVDNPEYIEKIKEHEKKRTHNLGTYT